MSDAIISIAAEGMDLPKWEREFRSAISQHTDLGATVLPSPAPGTFGARRGGNVKVKTDGAASEDKAIKVIAIILSTLSLSVAAVQLGITVHQVSNAKHSSVTCTIEGPTGIRTLSIPQAGMVSEDLVRECLGQTGYPHHIKATPHDSR